MIFFLRPKPLRFDLASRQDWSLGQPAGKGWNAGKAMIRNMMKFILVNMISGKIAETPVPEQYQMLGGRGLISSMINDRGPAVCGLLSEKNLLIFAPGLLSGTPLVNTGRLSVGAKSPLTGGIKESNVGGTVSSALSRHGIRAVRSGGAAWVR
jgi:aldehyde:ferredoxin oxidoreductase